MIKTLTLDGLTSVTIKQSAYDMARFCRIENRSDSPVFVSCKNPDCTENADEVTKIPANGIRTIDTESFMTLYLRGSGEVEIMTSAYSELLSNFKQPSKGGGASLSGETAYTISNAVDYPLLGLSLYGRSAQDGTPTPENPVDIVSVGGGGFDIVAKNDTHFNLLSVRDNGKGIITKQPVSVVGKNGETKQFVVSASGSGLTYQWWQNVNNDKGWVIMDTSGARQPIFSIPVAAFRNGYKYRCVVTDGNGNSETSNEVTLYVVSDECEITTASIATNIIPLCGIPVSEGGNYTDKSGQQWICDTLVYNADGTGSIIKNTAKIESYNGEAITTPFISTTGSLTTGATVIYQTDAPQEIALTAADVSALMQLHTYSGVTNITNSNSAEMDVKYCTDRSLSEYVMPVITNMQAQIDELKSAVLSLGGNV